MNTTARINLSLCFLLVIGILAATFAAPASAQSRLALLIGNSSYKNGPLRNPVNDVAAMNDSLKKAGFDVILIKDADRNKMGRAIDDFGRKLKNYDVGLFYFSGHGLQLNGRNYLVPLYMKIQGKSDVQYEAIDAGKVLAKMEDAGNAINIVILDACRNNPFKRSFRSADNGLAQMDAPTGSFIAFATAPGEVALDGRGNNSPYVTNMLRNIEKKGLTIEQFFKQVRRGVMKDTGKKQVPWESSSLVGDFYFTRDNDSSSSTPPSSSSSNTSSSTQNKPQQKPRPQKDNGNQALDFMLN